MKSKPQTLWLRPRPLSTYSQKQACGPRRVLWVAQAPFVAPSAPGCDSHLQPAYVAASPESQRSVPGTLMWLILCQTTTSVSTILGKSNVTIIDFPEGPCWLLLPSPTGGVLLWSLREEAGWVWAWMDATVPTLPKAPASTGLAEMAPLFIPRALASGQAPLLWQHPSPTVL